MSYWPSWHHLNLANFIILAIQIWLAFYFKYFNLFQNQSSSLQLKIFALIIIIFKYYLMNFSFLIIIFNFLISWVEIILLIILQFSQRMKKNYFLYFLKLKLLLNLIFKYKLKNLIKLNSLFFLKLEIQYFLF